MGVNVKEQTEITGEISIALLMMNEIKRKICLHQSLREKKDKSSSPVIQIFFALLQCFSQSRSQERKGNKWEEKRERGRMRKNEASIRKPANTGKVRGRRLKKS